MNDIKNEIRTHNNEKNIKIDHITEWIDEIVTTSDQNTNKIDELESNIECLKQDQLKNNICVSGVPSDLIKDKHPSDIVIEIAKALCLELTQAQFTSYAIANNKLIIIHTHDINTKILKKIREKKSLMVEEVFGIRSNSQVYLNDQLTPQFSKIFLPSIPSSLL